MSDTEIIPFRQRGRTEPGGYTAPACDGHPEAAARGPSAKRPESLRIIKPRPASNSLLRPSEPQLLMAVDRRDTPRRWLFDPTALTEPSGASAAQHRPPMIDVHHAPREAPASERRLGGPLRLAMAGLLTAGLLVVAVIWSLSDGEHPQAESTASLTAARPALLVSRVEPPVTTLTIASTPAAPAADTAEVTTASLADDKPQAAVPAKAPRSTKDDDASPFGKWMVPPRD